MIRVVLFDFGMTAGNFTRGRLLEAGADFECDDLAEILETVENDNK
ncbi:MAG: hypothetical protein Q4E34_06390 [Synergistaceae bacterium]|nr:hypothetical protein [Synergistaceae bacterium]